MVNAPDFVGHILLHNSDNYVKPDFLHLVLKNAIGKGLFTAEGPLWRTQRKIVAPTFAPEAKAKQHRFQYLPFGAGPRICLGARMAMAEALIVMAHWLAARRFDLVDDHIVRPIAGVTFRPMGGMPLMVSLA